MSFIGGMARCNRDALPYMIVEGHPPKCYGPNTVGLERAGMSKDQIARIRAIYKLLYRSHLNRSQALERIEAEIEPSAERDLLVNFVRASQRGVI